MNYPQMVIQEFENSEETKPCEICGTPNDESTLELIGEALICNDCLWEAQLELLHERNGVE